MHRSTAVHGSWREVRRLKSVALVLGITALLVAGSVSAIGIGGPAHPSIVRPSEARVSVPGPRAVHSPQGTGTGVPYVAKTLVLLNNSLVSGNFIAQSGVDPFAATYDSGTGSLYVTNLVSNSVSVIANGSPYPMTTVPVGLAPNGIAYDSGKGEIFVADQGEGVINQSNLTFNGSALTVISDTNNSVVATIPVGFDPIGVAYDSGKGEIFIADSHSNNVTVVSDATNRIVTNISVGEHPWGVAYDPAAGLVFVTDWVSDNVSVISDSSNTVVATVGVGLAPMGVVYDPGTNEVYVACSGSDALSAFSAATWVAANPVPVGDYPVGVAYAPTSNEVFVSNADSDNVTAVFDANGSTAGAIGTGPDSEPWGVTFDNGTGDIVVTDSGSSNVSLVSGTTHTLTSSVRLSLDPGQVVDDTGTGELYVPEANANAVSVISDTTDRIVATVPVGAVPYTAVYDSAKSEIFVADTWSNNVSVISDVSNSVVATIPVGVGPDGLAYDSALGEVFVSNYQTDNLSVISDATDHVVATIPVGYYPGPIVYDSGTREVFVSDLFGYNISVVSTANNSSVASIYPGPGPCGGLGSFQGLAYDVAKGEIFATYEQDFGVALHQLCSDAAVISDATDSVVTNVSVGSAPVGATYVNVSGQILVANSGSDNVSVISDGTDTVVSTLAVGIEPTEIARDAGNGFAYVSNSGGGTLSIIAPGPGNSYGVSFVPTGLASGTSWSVSLDGAPTSGIGSLTYSGIPNGTYSYGVAPVAGYNVSRTTGSLTVNGSGVSVSVAFTATNRTLPPTDYPVTLEETGLAVGTIWSATLNGTPQSTSTSAIGYTEPNGSYSFTMASVEGYSVSPTNGTVVVAEGPANVHVSFTATPPPPAAEFLVSVVEGGLANETGWSADLGGTTESSTTDTIAFIETNGTYDLLVPSVTGLVANYSTPVVVRGTPVTVSVLFSNATYPVTIRETGLPEGVSWAVTAADTSTRAQTVGTSSASVIILRLPNGTYALSASGPEGYLGELSAGTLSIHGGTTATPLVTFSSANPGGLTGAAFPWLTFGVLSVTVLVAAIGAALGYSRYRFSERRSEGRRWIEEFNRDDREGSRPPPGGS
jgi:YVTN family beta-propeller protein